MKNATAKMSRIPKVGAYAFAVVGLAAGVAGTVAIQSHAESRSADATVAITNSANQSGSGHTAGSWSGSTGTQHAKPAVAGKVTAISGDTITLTSTPKSGTATTYTVDATNATITKVTPPPAPAAGSTTTPPTRPTPRVKPTSTTISVSQIAVGDTLIVQGTVSGTNVTATTIVDGAMFGGRGGHRPMGQKPAAIGKATAISGNTITLTSTAHGSKNGTATTYSVDATNATITKVSAPTAGQKPSSTTITVSQIAVGDTLIVQGAASGTNVTATKIVDGAGFGPGMGGFHGNKTK